MDTNDELDERFDDAIALLGEERFREAIEAFSDFIAVCPDSEGAYGNRGLAYTSMGDNESACADFQQVLRLNPDDAMAYAMLAELCRRQGLYEEALTYAAQSLALDEDDPQARFIRGWLFARGEQYELAVGDLQLAAEFEESPEETEDLLDVCERLLQYEKEAESTPPDDEADALVRDQILTLAGFAFDYRYNEEHETDGLFCPYAHCLRHQASLDEDAPTTCPVTLYACPGGIDQATTCQQERPYEP